METTASLYAEYAEERTLNVPVNTTRKSLNLEYQHLALKRPQVLTAAEYLYR